MATDESIDLYRLLQVDPAADVEIIQAAYRRLARRHHPDVAPGPDAAERMAQLNRAWAVLSDPHQRAAYDVDRARRGDAATPGGADIARSSGGSPGAGRRPSSAVRGDTPPGSVAGNARDRAPAPGGRVAQEMDPNWTSGRSVFGGGYDPATMRAPDGFGAAGPPPGRPSGSVLSFGRYAGWSIGEIARRDPDYLEWLDRVPIGRVYHDEVDAELRRLGRRRAAGRPPDSTRGLYRRR